MPENCPIVDHLIETYLKNFTGPNSLMSKNAVPTKIQLQNPVPLPRPITPKSPPTIQLAKRASKAQPIPKLKPPTLKIDLQ